MRIFMLGWEFPPYISGGLGTACEGLTRGLAQRGTRITFVLPRPVDATGEAPVKLLPRRARRFAPALLAEQGNGHAAHGHEQKISFHVVPTELPSPYSSLHPGPGVIAEAQQRIAEPTTVAPPADVPATARYSGDLVAEAQRYAALCVELARRETFDVIHAHDWLAFPAAMAVAAATGKPFIAHVHSTEFDRAGEGLIHRQIFEIERRGVHAATRVIAVSHLTRRILETRYDLRPEKIDVIYNAVDCGVIARVDPRIARIRSTDRVVLFLGRLTRQKGPEYFIEAARKVLEVIDDVKFIVAGSGDQGAALMDQAARAGIGGRVLFTGFLRGADVHRVFEIADVYVMPSISEPFGIAALEAISHDVPVILSKQSGVSEVVRHALKVDFWNTDDIADKIIAVLRHTPLAQTLRREADIEVRALTWTGAADKCLACYERARAAMPV